MAITEEYRCKLDLGYNLWVALHNQIT